MYDNDNYSRKPYCAIRWVLYIIVIVLLFAEKERVAVLASILIAWLAGPRAKSYHFLFRSNPRYGAAMVIYWFALIFLLIIFNNFIMDHLLLTFMFFFMPITPDIVRFEYYEWIGKEYEKTKTA